MVIADFIMTLSLTNMEVENGVVLEKYWELMPKSIRVKPFGNISEMSEVHL